MFKVGNCCYEGIGTTDNKKEAFEYYMKAAVKNCAK